MSTPTTASDPAVDPDRLEGFYTELAAMHIELDADPLELGPKRLNEKVAGCRSALSKCETIFLSLSQDLHRYKRALRGAEADFKLSKMDLFTNNPEVRMGRNVADREAIASNMLRPQAEEIDRLKSAVEELTAVLVVVRVKRADLKDIQGRLKDQLKICQEELTLGSRWGRSFPNMRQLPGSRDEAQDSVNETFARVLKPRELPPAEEDIPIPGDESEIPPVPELMPPALVGDETMSPDSALDAITERPTETKSDLFSDEGLDEVLKNLG